MTEASLDVQRLRANAGQHFTFTGGNQLEDVEDYWAGNPRLRDVSIHAYKSGLSLDYLLSTTLRSFSATSSGSPDHLPKMMKSMVTLKRSTSK